jgi:hypothetical protein
VRNKNGVNSKIRRKNRKFTVLQSLRDKHPSLLRKPLITAVISYMIQAPGDPLWRMGSQ